MRPIGLHFGELRNRLLIFALLMAVPVHAAAKKPATGTICIAPFHVRYSGPNMEQTTWAPTARSTFEFRVNKTKLKASVRQDEMAAIENVPADRRVLLGIRLDGRPFESFWVDLRKEPDRKLCLWLYEGYWHWVNMGWDADKGCRCGEPASKAQ